MRSAAATAVLTALLAVSTDADSALATTGTDSGKCGASWKCASSGPKVCAGHTPGGDAAEGDNETFTADGGEEPTIEAADYANLCSARCSDEDSLLNYGVCNASYIAADSACNSNNDDISACYKASMCKFSPKRPAVSIEQTACGLLNDLAANPDPDLDECSANSACAIVTFESSVVTAINADTGDTGFSVPSDGRLCLPKCLSAGTDAALCAAYGSDCWYDSGMCLGADYDNNTRSDYNDPAEPAVDSCREATSKGGCTATGCVWAALAVSTCAASDPTDTQKALECSVYNADPVACFTISGCELATEDQASCLSLANLATGSFDGSTPVSTTGVCSYDAGRRTSAFGDAAAIFAGSATAQVLVADCSAEDAANCESFRDAHSLPICEYVHPDSECRRNETRIELRNKKEEEEVYASTQTNETTGTAGSTNGTANAADGDGAGNSNAVISTTAESTTTEATEEAGDSGNVTTGEDVATNSTTNETGGGNGAVNGTVTSDGESNDAEDNAQGGAGNEVTSTTSTTMLKPWGASCKIDNKFECLTEKNNDCDWIVDDSDSKVCRTRSKADAEQCMVISNPVECMSNALCRYQPIFKDGYRGEEETEPQATVDELLIAASNHSTNGNFSAAEQYGFAAESCKLATTAAECAAIRMNGEVACEFATVAQSTSSCVPDGISGIDCGAFYNQEVACRATGKCEYVPPATQSLCFPLPLVHTAGDAYKGSDNVSSAEGDEPPYRCSGLSYDVCTEKSGCVIVDRGYCAMPADMPDDANNALSLSCIVPGDDDAHYGNSAAKCSRLGGVFFELPDGVDEMCVDKYVAPDACACLADNSCSTPVVAEEAAAQKPVLSGSSVAAECNKIYVEGACSAARTLQEDQMCMWVEPAAQEKCLNSATESVTDTFGLSETAACAAVHLPENAMPDGSLNETLCDSEAACTVRTSTSPERCVPFDKCQSSVFTSDQGACDLESGCVWAEGACYADVGKVLPCLGPGCCESAADVECEHLKDPIGDQACRLETTQGGGECLSSVDVVSGKGTCDFSAYAAALETKEGGDTNEYVCESIAGCTWYPGGGQINRCVPMDHCAGVEGTVCPTADSGAAYPWCLSNFDTQLCYRDTAYWPVFEASADATDAGGEGAGGGDQNQVGTGAPETNEQESTDDEACMDMDGDCGPGPGCETFAAKTECDTATTKLLEKKCYWSPMLDENGDPAVDDVSSEPVGSCFPFSWCATVAASAGQASCEAIHGCVWEHDSADVLTGTCKKLWLPTKGVKDFECQAQSDEPPTPAPTTAQPTETPTQRPTEEPYGCCLRSVAGQKYCDEKLESSCEAYEGRLTASSCIPGGVLGLSCSYTVHYGNIPCSDLGKSLSDHDNNCRPPTANPTMAPTPDASPVNGLTVVEFEFRKKTGQKVKLAPSQAGEVVPEGGGLPVPVAQAILAKFNKPENFDMLLSRTKLGRIYDDAVTFDNGNMQLRFQIFAERGYLMPKSMQVGQTLVGMEDEEFWFPLFYTRLGLSKEEMLYVKSATLIDIEPSDSPTPQPTARPTNRVYVPPDPSPAPSNMPTFYPTPRPTSLPSAAPTLGEKTEQAKKDAVEKSEKLAEIERIRAAVEQQKARTTPPPPPPPLATATLKLGTDLSAAADEADACTQVAAKFAAKGSFSADDFACAVEVATTEETVVTKSATLPVAAAIAAAIDDLEGTIGPGAVLNAAIQGVADEMGKQTVKQMDGVTKDDIQKSELKLNRRGARARRASYDLVITFKEAADVAAGVSSFNTKVASGGLSLAVEVDGDVVVAPAAAATDSSTEVTNTVSESTVVITLVQTDGNLEDYQALARSLADAQNEINTEATSAGGATGIQIGGEEVVLTETIVAEQVEEEDDMIRWDSVALGFSTLSKDVLLAMYPGVTAGCFDEVDSDADGKISKAEHESGYAATNDGRECFMEYRAGVEKEAVLETLDAQAEKEREELAAVCEGLTAQGLDCDQVIKDEQAAKKTTAPTIPVDTSDVQGAGAATDDTKSSGSGATGAIVITVIALAVVGAGVGAFIYVRKNNMDLKADSAMSNYANPTYAAGGAGLPGAGLPGAPAGGNLDVLKAAEKPKLVRQESLC